MTRLRDAILWIAVLAAIAVCAIIGLKRWETAAAERRGWTSDPPAQPAASPAPTP